uniref:T26-22p n=1 Tax=Thermococcus sp. 26/2 TaxID=758583 RepID=D6MY45_9EURY|nr:t26-22p [Thermococcus sp. 26/2]
MDQEEVRIYIETSPLLRAFQELLKEAKTLEDENYLPAEFRGYSLDYIDFYTVIFKRRGRFYWVLDYHRPRVVLHKVIRRKVVDEEGRPVKDEATGEPVVEEVPIHEQTILNLVPVEIRAFRDFTLELAARELGRSPPILYQWTVALNSWKGPVIQELEPVLAVELLDRLKEIGGLFSSEPLAKEAIDTILTLARYLNALRVEDRPMAPGIYWNPNTGKLEAYDFDTSMPSREEVREALLLLDEITKTVNKTSWRESWPYKFGRAIKWALAGGLGYAYKVYNEKRRWIPYLLLIGESQTGKTHSVGRVIAEIWSSPFTSSGASWSLYTLSELIASRASVLILNEAANLFRSLNRGDEDDNLFNLLKNAPEQYLFRFKSYKGSIKIYPSLATFVFTANMSAPRNEAIRRRFLTVEFTKVDKIPKEAQGRFEREIVPKMGVLSAIGRFVFNLVKADPKLLDNHWIDLAELLVEALYSYAGLSVPQWLREASLEEDFIEELEAEKVEYVTTWLRRHFNELYLKNVKKSFEDRADYIRERVEYVLRANYSEYFYLRDGEVIIFRSLLDALKADKKDLDIYSFRDLCNLMDWSYERKTINRKTYRVAVVPLQDFLDQVAPMEKEEYEQEVFSVLDEVVNVLAMQPLSFEELAKQTGIPETVLRTAIDVLKTKGVVFEAENKLVLDRKKAVEAGLNVVYSGMSKAGGV